MYNNQVSSFPLVLPVLRVRSHVHGQGAHPHRPVWQHVSVRQAQVPPRAERVWLHLA